jgi:hypothetical protein
VPTSKRPQTNDTQYPRILGKVLKGMSDEEIVGDIVVKVAMSGFN